MAPQKRTNPDEPQIDQFAKRRRSSSEEDEMKPAPAAANGSGTRPNKIRFGSEELDEWSRLMKGESIDDQERALPPSDEPAPPKLTEVTEEDEEGSDDEAPEAVGTADAEALAKTKQAESARALQVERERARKQRQDRAAQLDSQARQSARKARTGPGLEDTATSETSKPYRRSELPDLLPEHVLAESIARDRDDSPTSDGAADIEAAAPSKKKRLIKFDSHPEDRQAGPVRVSVLKERSHFMAPKGNKASRSIRQNWLAGRRGKKQALERYKPNRGFLVS